MKCPVCKVLLTRINYEGFTIPQCPRCLGHLVANQRVEFIKGRRNKTPEDLMNEVSAASGADTVEKLKCPGCARQMTKLRQPPPADFLYDVCEKCETTWFDGGELARLQLSYQISDQGKEAAELQRRLREMSPERKAEFEANLAALPDAESEVAGILLSALTPPDRPLGL